MKFGLGEPYEDVSVLSPKVRAWLDLTKPASTLGIMFAVMAGSVFYVAYTGNSVPLRDIIAVSIVSAASHGASQAMNMAEDAEMDADTEHKQNRPIPSGEATKEEARAISWILMVVSVSWAFLINTMFGVFISTLILLGVFYNLDPIRAKERIISIPWQATSRGLFFYPTIWAAYGDPFSVDVWALGLFMFFYVFGFQNTADFIDKDADERHGVKTFVVAFGIQRTNMIAFGSMFMMIATIITAMDTGVLPDRMAAILMIIPFCMVMLYHMTNHPDKVSSRTGNHPAWLWFYIGMVLSVIIPMTTELVY